MRKHRNQSGFSAVGIVITILLVCVIGLGGYFIWHRSDSKNTTNTSIQIPSSAIYASWKTYSLGSEGASIKYPSSWKIFSTNRPDAVSGSTNVMITSPTTDTLQDSAGNTISGAMQVSITYGDVLPPTETTGNAMYLVSSTPFSVPGYKTLRILNDGFGSTKNVTELSLSDTTATLGTDSFQTDTYTSKADSSYVVTVDAGLYGQPANGSGGYISMSPDTFTSLDDYTTALNILKSLTYR
jgi:hypothetical protein